MAKKAIIDIDINDEQFQKFREAFDAYAEKLEDQPEAWRRLGEAMGIAGSSLTSSVSGTSETLERSASTLERIVDRLDDAAHAQRQLERETALSNRGFSGLVKRSRTFLHNIKEAGSWLMRIGTSGLATGLVGSVGLIGLGNDAYRRQREALGLGITPGQVAAFDTRMSPYIDKGLLEKSANAQQDIGKWWSFSAMGINPRKATTENPEDLAFSLVTAARKIWKEGPQTQQYAEARGLTQFFSLDELRRLSATSGHDLGESERRARTDAKTLGFSREVGEEWTALKVSLQKIGIEISTVFIKGLAPLAKPFSALAKSVAGDIVKFVDNGGLKKLIESVKHGMEEFSGFVGSKKFQHDIASFAKGLDLIAKGVDAATGDMSPLTSAGRARAWKDITEPFRAKRTPLTESQIKTLPAPARIFEEGIRYVRHEINAVFGSPSPKKNHGLAPVMVHIYNSSSSKVATSTNAAGR